MVRLEKAMVHGKVPVGVSRNKWDLYRSDQIFEIFGKWFGNLGKPSGLLQAVYILHGLPE